MKRTCRCSGSKCSGGEVCIMMLSDMKNVAKKLKTKYEQSVHLTAPSDVDTETETKGELIYFNNSISYCTPNPDYSIRGIAGRECTLNNNHTSSSHHCNNLCCDRGHEEFIVEIPRACNCEFVWCCKIECDTCYEAESKHRCKA